ncbi:NAD-dependent epimerase/dehydratase family protein [Sphingomonas sp. ASY06-1R]|uniref:NAD-dependent epimerase/dehydratase family protein n=1 Tax=Sphingomonas sp. ASY06-1R TaxID=3445771 RepID=UPI003FA2216F
MRIAVTGGTGFVGSHLIEQALAAGHQVRALTRRPQPPQVGLTWIDGSLDQPQSLARLCKDCDAVVHIAGVINGTPEAFHAGNVMGTEAMLTAAAGASITRFIHISSLAAREPQLSAYGRSKYESEEPVIAAGRNWTIIRPPAIYGPRDHVMLELFRFAKRRLLPLPPGNGRLSLIHVRDLCDLILACLPNEMSFCRTYEPDDGRSGGWSTVEMARAIGRAVGKAVLPISIPKALLPIGVRVDRLVRGKNAQLTSDRMAYYCHPDWTAAPHAHPPAELWHARIPTEDGLKATASWYRAEGWL